MFNVNDVVELGIRSRGASWAKASHIPRYLGIINTITDKKMTVYVPSYHGDVGEVTVTLRSNGKWIQQGEPDDKFDRVRVREYAIGSIDTTEPRKYFNLLHLGVDRKVLDSAITEFISEQIDMIFDEIHEYQKSQLEETTEKGRDYWDKVISQANHRLSKVNEQAVAHLKLKAMPLTDSPFESA